MDTNQTVKPARAPLENGQYYKHICCMALPLVCMAAYLYGLRPVLLCAAAALLGNLCDRAVAVLRRRTYRTDDLSSESFALVIALLLPASVPWYALVTAVLAGVLVGKEAFGGYGSYPFHPSAVGYAVAAVSWPEQVTRYPQPHTMLPLGDCAGVPLAEGISATLRNGGVPNINIVSLLLGEFAAPLGAGAALVIVACGIFLLAHKDIHFSAMAGFLCSCALIAFVFPRQGDISAMPLMASAAARLRVVQYELLSGAVLFGAVFLLNEPYTCPRRRLGRVLYGVLLGAVSMGFGYYGVYEAGVCFALLMVNSLAGWLDRVTERLIPALAKRGISTEGGEAL